MRIITSADFSAFDWEAVRHSYRRRLPHLTLPGAIYFVTFRLMDSLPVEVSQAWNHQRAIWLKTHPPPWDNEVEKEYHRRFTLVMERYLDAGHGSCLLRDSNIRQEVIQSLLHDDHHRYELGDWVIMPNHVHALLKPLVPAPISSLLGPLKGACAHRINQRVEQHGPLWMDESFDHIVRGLDSLKKFQRYVANNPVKAGLKSSEYTYEQRWEIHES